MSKSELMDALSARAAAGERLTDADLGALEQANVLALGMVAEAARKRAGRDVTYTRVHLVDAGSAQSLDVPEEAAEVRVRTLPTSLDDAIGLVGAVRRAAGSDRRLTAFSLADLQDRSSAGWGGLDAIARALSEAGADDVAELPLDRIEQAEHAIRALRNGNLAAARVTIDQPTRGRRLALIGSLRALQDSLGGIGRFAPLARRPAVDVPTTGYDDLRTIGLARLALGDLAGTSAAVSIEVDWSLYGPKLAQVALIFGADHLDAVPAISDPALGARRDAAQDVERNIRAAGFEPKASDRRSA